jgi:hypothetical protein
MLRGVMLCDRRRNAQLRGYAKQLARCGLAGGGAEYLQRIILMNRSLMGLTRRPFHPRVCRRDLWCRRANP